MNTVQIQSWDLLQCKFVRLQYICYCIERGTACTDNYVINLHFDYQPGKTKALYYRWGHDDCPETAEVIYSGKMAGASFEDRGGGSNTQCLPKDPEYSSDVGMAQNRAYIYGAEFDSNTRTSDLHDIPCALCFLANHSTTYM